MTKLFALAFVSATLYVFPASHVVILDIIARYL